MTAFERVRRTQRALELVIGSSVLFWACTALLVCLTIGAALSALIALPLVFRGIIPIVAVLVALVTLGVLAWRGRFAWSFDRVALWIEEHAPQLRYALVTAIDPRYQGETAQLMEPVIARVDTGPFVRTAAKRSTLPAAIAFLAALGVFLAIPNSWKKQISTPGFFPSSAKAIVGNRLVPLSGTVTAPSYANIPVQKFSEPSTITGLVGSTVTITGNGDPDGIDISLEEIPSEASQPGLIGDTAAYDTTDEDLVMPSGDSDDSDNSRSFAHSLFGNNAGAGGKGAPSNGSKKPSGKGHPTTKGDANQSKGAKPAQNKGRASSLSKPPLVKKLTVVAGGKGWMTTFALSDSNPALLKLVDRQYHRSIVIDPRVDQPPVGRLLLPARDTTLRTISGNLNLSAIFNDDIGLATARFDYIKCSSGTDDPEDVKCVQGSYGTHAFGNTKSGDFSMSIPFASLHLKEGDQLSVRGVILDNKPKSLGGPDSGVTESRNIRVARKSEYDKLNINPAPPSADTALVTLRMLIIAVKHLDSVYNIQHKMAQKPYEDSAIKLGGVAQQVKNKLQLIIQEQTGDGEVPEDPRLKLADDSLFSAVRDLYIADTHGSIPPLEAAYNALKDFSNTARYYLRGQLPVPNVNIDRVRLTGKDTGITTPRTPRQVSNADRAQYLRTYVSAVQQMRTSADSAVETFTLLRVETLRRYPDLAQAVGDAVTAIQTKKNPASSLLRARRILEGAAAALDTLPLWSGAW